MDTRHKNKQWRLLDLGTPNSDGSRGYENATIHMAILMDIRDELQELNRLLNCANFLAIPTVLRGIEKNTRKKIKLKLSKKKAAC